jgi:hypothetical protein
MSLLPVLWKQVTQLFQVPEDVRLYVLFHFHMPFVKAEREKERIDKLYYFDTRSSDDMNLKEKEVRSLLADRTVELDIRVLRDRIETYVCLVEELILYARVRPIDALGVLYKGLEIGNSVAFCVLYREDMIDRCYQAPLLVERTLGRLRSLETWETLYEIGTFIQYFLGKDMCDTVKEICALLTIKNGPRLYLMQFMPEERTKLIELRVTYDYAKVFGLDDTA